MHAMTCQCRGCRGGSAFKAFEFEFEDETEASLGARDGESPFSEAEESEFALELLSVASEEELDQFLGKLFKGAWKGLKKIGSAVGKIARPLGGVLKGLAKKALPFVGGALGSFIPIPGVGSAIGSALGSAVSSALEAEFGELEAEEQEFEMAKRFVRIAGAAAQQAARQTSHTDDLHAAARAAVMRAARQHLPHMSGGSARTGASGRWERHGGQIVLVGV